MELSDFLVNKFYQLKGRRNRILVGITGRAGSGKTTLSKVVAQELNYRGIDNIIYSGDWRFALDSTKRKETLKEKWKSGINAYLNAANQFNWWDYNSIFNDLSELVKGNDVEINHAYNRVTGQKDLSLKIHSIERGIVFYENAILGGVEHLNQIDAIILINTPDLLCFERTIKKDTGRRTLYETVIRYLMTTYSENIFLERLFDQFKHKIVSCDSYGALGDYPRLQEISYIPIPIVKRKSLLVKKGTVFCYLDGTIINHVPVPTETGEEIKVIQGSAEKLQEFRQKGYFLVLTTSRPQNKIFGVLEILKEKGLEFDQIICDLPVGPRHLINDTKNGEIRAFAHVIERDEGINNINLP